MPSTTTTTIPIAAPGSETSSQPVSSLPATLMSAASKTSERMTSAVTPSAISSPGLGAGRSHSDLQDGQQTHLSGRGAVRVSRFRALASDAAMPINDMSGPLFTVSSPSAALQRFLENRLRGRMVVNGSPEYELTWKQQDMPAGPPICALRASARRTFGNDSTGWPTPTSTLADKGVRTQRGGRIEAMRAPGPDLAAVATLSGWVSPTAEDHRRGNKPSRPWDTGTPLTQQVVLAGWASPINRDWRSGQVTDATMQRNSRPLNEQAVNLAAGGAMPTTCPAPTEKRGALNPLFSLWLILGTGDLARAWASCAPPATRSSRRSRRNSSEP